MFASLRLNLLYGNAQEIKGFAFREFGAYKDSMSDTIRKDAAQEWRQLCQAAFFELDALKLVERIAEARSAVLARIEDTLPKPINDEQSALRKASATLSTLHELAERDICDQKRIA